MFIFLVLGFSFLFFGFWVLFAFFFIFVFFYPNVLGHTDNYIPANPLVTPTHIVPEWYFLPFYAILRSIPDKLMGVVSLLNSILVLLIVPFLFQNDKLNKGFLHSSYHKFLFWFFFFNCLVLGWIGGKSIETPYYEIGQIATVFYFLYFFLLVFFDLINNREFLLLNKFSFFHSRVIFMNLNNLFYSFIYFLNLNFSLTENSFKKFYQFHFLGSSLTLYDKIFKS